MNIDPNLNKNLNKLFNNIDIEEIYEYIETRNNYIKYKNKEYIWNKIDGIDYNKYEEIIKEEEIKNKYLGDTPMILEDILYKKLKRIIKQKIKENKLPENTIYMIKRVIYKDKSTYENIIDRIKWCINFFKDENLIKLFYTADRGIGSPYNLDIYNIIDNYKIGEFKKLIYKGRERANIILKPMNIKVSRRAIHNTLIQINRASRYNNIKYPKNIDIYKYMFVAYTLGGYKDTDEYYSRYEDRTDKSIYKLNKKNTRTFMINVLKDYKNIQDVEDDKEIQPKARKLAIEHINCSYTRYKTGIKFLKNEIIKDVNKNEIDNIYNIDKGVTLGQLNKYWKKTVPADINERNHAFKALIKTMMIFGGYTSTIIDKMIGNDIPIHTNININILGGYNPEIIEFVKKHIRIDLTIEKWIKIIGIIGQWPMIKQKNLENKKIEEILKEIIIYNIGYENIKSYKFAAIAAEVKVSKNKYNKWEDKWINGISQIKVCNIPHIEIYNSGYKGYTMDRNDPKGLFLGEYTNCCQAPGGVGKSCAWHGATNENGGFFSIIDKNNKIIAQSWLWRKDDILVIDNIEGLFNEKTAVMVDDIYNKFSIQVKNKMGIKEVIMGTSHNKLLKYKTKYESKRNPVEIPEGLYTDAYNVIVM